MGVTLLIRVGVTETGTDTGAVDKTSITKIRQHKQIPVGVTLLIHVRVTETGTDTGAVDNTNITKKTDNTNKYLWVLHY